MIRPPVDLLDAAGTRSNDLRLSYVFHRRTAPLDSGAVDEETALHRRIDLPVARPFTVEGKLRLSPDIGDDQLDALLGVGGAKMTSSSGLRGDARSRASKAIDGDTTTSWQSSLNPEGPQWVEFAAPTSISGTLDSLTVLADGRHSVPTRAHLEVDGVAQPTFDLRPADDGDRGTVRTLDIDPQAFSGSVIRLVIDEFRAVTAPDWLTHSPVTLPVGIAELGSDALATLPTKIEPGLSTCRSDLVTLDGAPIPVQITNATPDLDSAERGELVAFSGCPGVEGGINSFDVAKGSTRVDTADGRASGLDVDQLVLTSDPTGASSGPAATSVGLDVTTTSPVSYTVTPTKTATEPYWLVLGQSNNAGWHLTVGDQDLGEPTLVNGYANGWRIDPAKVGAQPTFHLDWTPQRPVWIALLLSGLGFLICLVLAFRPAKAQIRGAGAPMHPDGLGLLDTFGRPVAWRQTAVACGVAAVGCGVFVGPVWAIPGVVAMLVGLRTDLGWRAVRFAALGALGLAAAYVVAKQWRNDYPLDFDWPQHFEAVHSLGMFAYALLGVECTIEVLRAGWRRSADLELD